MAIKETVHSRIGRQAPLHCTALVAWEPEDWLTRFLRRRLRPCTPSPLTEAGDFRHELLKIRTTRCVLDGEEFALGLKCIAAPLFDHSRRVVASIDFAGPSVRLSSDCLPRLASLARSRRPGSPELSEPDRRSERRPPGAPCTKVQLSAPPDPPM